MKNDIQWMIAYLSDAIKLVTKAEDSAWRARRPDLGECCAEVKRLLEKVRMGAKLNG